VDAKGRTAEIMIAEARKAFWLMVGFLAVIWVVQIVKSHVTRSPCRDRSPHSHASGRKSHGRDAASVDQLRG
jgi:hypothetical protein